MHPDRPLTNTIVYLLGHPGVGKYTVARKLAAKTGAHIVDNHYVNNPILGLVETDGVTPLPKEVWARVGEVRSAVLQTVAELSPHGWSFIFTNALTDDPESRSVFAEVLGVAERRGSAFAAVRLLCEPKENARRIALPERRARMKDVNPEGARGRNRDDVLEPNHPNTLTLDVTGLEPEEAAERILAFLASVSADE